MKENKELKKMVLRKKENFFKEKTRENKSATTIIKSSCMSLSWNASRAYYLYTHIYIYIYVSK